MRGSREAGFTLLEVLVVVTLVAILGAAVTVSLSNRGDRGLETVAEGLRDALNHAAESAVLTGRAYGLFVAPEGYETVVYDGETWQSADAGHASLAEPYRLTGSGVYASRRRAAPTPQMVLMPDGEHHLAEVAIENRISGERWVLEALPGGRYGVVHGKGPR